MIESVPTGELVLCIARGEPARDAEAEICRRFTPRIRLYGLRHLRTEDRAADLVQGVLLAVLEAARAGRISELEHVERFVLGTCRHVVQRVREREARMTLVDSAALDVEVSHPEYERVDMSALMGCLAKLDSRSRSVVLQSFQAENSAEEIASFIETSPGNVRIIRHRALLQLRRCLDSGEGARS